MTQQILLSLLNCLWKLGILGGLTLLITRRLRTKPRFLFLAALYLIIGIPILSMAQLIPLKTIPVSLFAQTSEETEKPKDEAKNQKRQKAETETKEKKEYKDSSKIEVKDPSLSISSAEEKIFSGPQVGEKLPSFNVTGMYGEIEGETFDITSTDGQPLILFVQDANGVGIKGFSMILDLFLTIADYQKQQNSKSEDSNQSLQLGVVFLIDDVVDLPDWSGKFLENWLAKGVMVCMSPDGREGPGSYGLNRNVAQTILIANDGKVVHNFAFTQPMLYTDPYVLGAVSQAIGVEPSTMEKWLNKKSANQKMKMNADEKSAEYYVSEIKKALMNGKISKEDAVIKLVDLGVNPEKAASIINQTKDTSQKRDPSPEEQIRRDRDPSPEERIRRDRNPEERQIEREGDRERDPSPEEQIRRDRDPSPEEQIRRDRSPEGRQTEREGNRDKDPAISPELLVRLFDKDKDGMLNEEERMTVQRLMDSRKNQNRNRRRKVEVKDPDEFKRNRENLIYSGPQPSEKLPSLMATVINGDDEGKTIDFIAKANGKSHILVLQDETPLGLRGLVAFTRILEDISQKSKQEFQIQVVFLGDSPEALFQQAKKIVPHIPENILLGISPDGREGPGSYGLNRNMAQTVIIANNGVVLHNFPLTQPMLSPDPYVLGAICELIGEKPATLEKWLNAENPIIKIKNPSEKEENGVMLLKGTFALNGTVVDLDETVVNFDGLLTFLRSLPEVPESMLIIEAEREVSHEQIVKVMDIAKEAGIDKIGFAIREVEDKSMESDKAQGLRNKDSN